MAEGDAAAFSERLAALKGTGATVLVAGEDATATAAVSSQLLGDGAAGREPVFALLGRDRSVVRERLGRPLDGSRIVEYGFSRSASSRGAGTTDAASARPLRSLDDLLGGITDALAVVEAEREDPLAAGELRVCLDSMSPVVDRFDRRRVEGFLSDFRAAVVDRSGIGHAVIPARPASDRYGWLAGCFDVVVGARSVDGVPRERWELPDTGHRTEWFPVADADVG